MASGIKTRFLIISDTHGSEFAPEDRPMQAADVVLHCGDLTDGSKLSEYRTAIDTLKALDAPVKLVIAGNHDFTMDFAAFTAKVRDADQSLDPELVAREYGRLGDARQLFEDAQAEGIKFLDEGTHTFDLPNGAALTVYASPYTPSLGQWGFQYHPDQGHYFDMRPDTDIVMTHGPPKGIMDMTYGRERAGCPALFTAVSRSRPKLHCFGHIHEGWGAKLVTWKGTGTAAAPTHFTAIDNERSPVIEKFASLRKGNYDGPETVAERATKLRRLAQDRCAITSHCAEDEYPLQSGEQTLFVNASIEGGEEFRQRPWLVDLELQRSKSK